MKMQPSSIDATRDAILEKVGAPATMASVMPVSAWIAGGIGASGSTRLAHSVTRGGDDADAQSTRTMPISVMRSASARVPVVSRSTKAKAGKGSIGAVAGRA